MSEGVMAIYRREHINNPEMLDTPQDVDSMIDSLLAGPRLENLAQLFSLRRPLLRAGNPDHELLVGVDEGRQAGILALMDNGNAVTLGPSRLGRGEVVYHILGRYREFPDRSEVPLDLIRQAVKEFLMSGGRRPTCVEWQIPEF